MTAVPQPKAVTPSVNGWNAEHLDAEYQRFKQDRDSVPEDLRSFFQGVDLAMAGAAPAGGGAAMEAQARFQAAVERLVEAYRAHGHFAAKLDPFGRERPRPPELTLESHGLSERDLDRPVRVASLPMSAGGTLRSVVDHLERTWCRSIAAEVMHVADRDQRAWLVEQLERGPAPLSREQRTHVLHQLLKSEEFEKFLGKRYPGDKRFSLEGSESVIPLLDELVHAAAETGVEEIVLGMAHRGRLNVLNNIVGKTYEQIFTEFEDSWEEAFADGGGDVKYHRGYSGERTARNGKVIHLALASNPSHLESVNGVVEGRCRAKQRLRGDLQRRRVVPVLIHGDAALPGQGPVQELLNFARLDGYTTGGTVHVVINNLIGFTTSPEDGRSTPYCTDIAKSIDAPVLHVNGEDPESVVWTAKLAVEFRQRFNDDIFVDVYCFRRYGHNEQDEASFTQPLLYALIRKKPSVLKVYAERLLAEGAITEADMAAIRTRLDEALEAAQAAAKSRPRGPNIDPGGDRWKGMGGDYTHDPVPTGVPPEVIAEVCAALGRVPAGFRLHPKLKGLLEARAALLTTKALSYADCESLAFGTLLLEGTAVRLSGQDSRRGTFSHRHAVLRDQESGEAYTPLNHMRELGRPGTDAPPGSAGANARPRQSQFCVHDSPLSEAAIMAFEYGYSLADPNMLVMWEGQFGDFYNGAQVIVDQYLASAEIKWQRWSGLVLLLPHGYEGAGPEHSSARLERFLQLCADDNMQVVHPSTGPQVFHLLRRQVRRNFRKPLVILTPKSLLRVPTGTTNEILSGTRFHEVMDDPAFIGGSRGKPADRSTVKRVILCSGKVYWELAERRDKIHRADVAIVRVEQLYPLHEKLLNEVVARYPAAERVWVQEEPRNMGAYLFMEDAVRAMSLGPLAYIGREPSATPATGSKSLHKGQQEEIISRAVGPKPAGESKAGH
ncbi:MAG: 2-oxoglutarate dehydrogenase E1 component [Phycisphaerales bacterium]